jgi:acetyl esterase/lipase
LLALLPACSSVDVLNALVPSEGYSVVSNLAYGHGPRHRLDLYVPDDSNDGAPLIVFFYGGGWETGERRDYRFVGEAFASLGYMVAIPDYRLHPEIRYPAFLKDAASAIAWVNSEVGAVAKVQPGPLYLTGHSAGAYITAMLTLDQRWLATEGLAVCDVVSAAPYETQPISHVNGAAPPMLLITGATDTTVLPRNTTALAATIRATGGTVQQRVYEDTGHVTLAAALAKPLRSLAPTLSDIDHFLRLYPKTEGCRKDVGG